MNCDSFPLSCTNYSISADGSLTSSPANDCKYKVERSVDEDGGTTYTFTNGLGNEVLVRRMEGEVAMTRIMYTTATTCCATFSARLSGASRLGTLRLLLCLRRFGSLRGETASGLLRRSLRVRCCRPSDFLPGRQPT